MPCEYRCVVCNKIPSPNRRKPLKGLKNSTCREELSLLPGQKNRIAQHCRGIKSSFLRNTNH